MPTKNLLLYRSSMISSLMDLNLVKNFALDLSFNTNKLCNTFKPSGILVMILIVLSPLS